MKTSFITLQNLNISLFDSIKSDQLLQEDLEFWRNLISQNLDVDAKDLLASKSIQSIFFHRIFPGRVFEESGESQQSIADLREQFAAQSEMQTSSDEAKNILAFNNNNTNWLRALIFQDIGIRTSNLNSDIIRPKGSFAFKMKLGGPVLHVYEFSSLYMFPVYAGYLYTLQALILYSANSFLVIKSKSCSLDNNDIDILCTSIESAEDEFIACRSRDPAYHLLACNMNNYGHSVINEISSLDAIRQLLISNPDTRVSILIGFADFFGYNHLISLVRHQVGGNLSVNRMSALFKKRTVKNTDFFFCKDVSLGVFSSLRPTRYSLNLLRNTILAKNTKASHPQNANETVIYLSFDNRGGRRRSGKRYCINKLDIFRAIYSYCLHESFAPTKIVIDGITALCPTSPAQSKSVIHCSDIKEEDLVAIANQLSSQSSPDLIIIDSLPYQRKMEVLSSLPSLSIAICPYGSSMIFPVYILNAITLIYGSEAFGERKKKWEWHVARGCHPDRMVKPIYIQASVYSDTGYQVEITDLLSKFSDILPLK